MGKNLYSIKPESSGGDTHNNQQGRLALRWGKVVEISPDHSQVRIETDELDEIPTYWVSILYPKTLYDKYYWCVDLDEHVWFLWDEQGEEGVVLGAFYCAEVLPEAPDIEETEAIWRDCSYERYHKVKHERFTHIRGDKIIEAKRLIIRVEELIIEANEIEITAGSISITGATGIALNGGNLTMNGTQLVGIGGMDTKGLPMVTTGWNPAPGVSPNIAIPDPCWDGASETTGDLRRLQGYTPPGWGGG